MNYLIYERSEGTAADWTGELSQLALDGWRVHTVTFPKPRMIVALLYRGATGQAVDPAAIPVDRPVDEADPLGVSWGPCVVCGVTAELDAQRVCGDHAHQGDAKLETPRTRPRRSPR